MQLGTDVFLSDAGDEGDGSACPLSFSAIGEDGAVVGIDDSHEWINLCGSVVVFVATVGSCRFSGDV